MKEIIAKAKELKPILRIGKSGLTEGMIKEIKKQLKQKKLIKIKFLPKEKTNKKEYAKEIASKTDSELIQQVGFVCILKYKGEWNGVPRDKTNRKSRSISG